MGPVVGVRITHVNNVYYDGIENAVIMDNMHHVQESDNDEGEFMGFE